MLYMKSKIIVVITLLAVFIVIFFIFFNKSQTKINQISSDKIIEKCIQNLTEYYKNDNGIVSTETGKISVGFEENKKAEVLTIIAEYNLTVEKDYGSFVYFVTPRGEEINYICLISKDVRLKDKINFIEPDLVITGSGN